MVGLAALDGPVAGTAAFGPWGEPQETTGEQSRLGYQGDLTDPDTGLVDMLTRLYDPAIGRFISRDVLFGEPERPLSLNQFAYGDGNPITYSDPLGLCPAGEGSQMACTHPAPPPPKPPAPPIATDPPQEHDYQAHARAGTERSSLASPAPSASSPPNPDLHVHGPHDYNIVYGRDTFFIYGSQLDVYILDDDWLYFHLFVVGNPGHFGPKDFAGSESATQAEVVTSEGHRYRMRSLSASPDPLNPDALIIEADATIPWDGSSVPDWTVEVSFYSTNVDPEGRSGSLLQLGNPYRIVW